MLSYQHGYHAGNPADVHKHALLALALARMTAKDKPIRYLETHAGRGLYDLSAAQASRTGEWRAGVGRLLDRVPADHPWRRAVVALRDAHGPSTYPGSPLVAAHLLRDGDRMDLAELHPAEHAALRAAVADGPAGPRIRVHMTDGLGLAHGLIPPTPRRGLMLIDPSWEVKADYDRLAARVPRWHRAWNVGVLMLWYPILADARHAAMLAALRAALPRALVSEVRFPPARPGHGMVGSGMFVVNPPYGLAEGAAELTRLFEED